MLRVLLTFILSVIFTSSAWAEGRYASIIVDADTQDVIHARQIDSLRFPASLTKVMTLHLVFDALDAGTLKLGERVKVSRTAARTPPVKLGLRRGQTITVDQLIQSVAVRSHNDSAVVLAERLGGTEARFAEMMTAKARSLGMQRTTFKTANGLPHLDQKTTARDMAKLAHSILTTHYDRYHYFGQTHFRGVKNTNALLHDMAEVDGFKTGYTNASGYNLMVSATRNNRRQIAIVLGGASGKSRNKHMRELVERGFDVMGVVPQAQPPALILANHDTPTAVLRGASIRREVKPWAIQIKNLASEADALKMSAAISPKSPAKITSGFIQGVPVFHARVAGLSHANAKKICSNIQSNQPKTKCWLIAP